MNDAQNWAGRFVIVLGLARSGAAVAKLLHRLGAKVLVNELKPRSECESANELESLGIQVICDGHPDDLISDEVDLVVKNPGIPYRAKPVQQALGKGIPVITEVEIAGLLSKGPIIGITGSNGKTTTTTLVGQMLTKGRVKNTVAGNIGQALSDVVQTIEPDEWLVAELSSFQLKGTERFASKIAALLNVFPAHLDYHQTLEDYISSKQKLFLNQTKEDVAIFNLENEICRQVAADCPGRVYWFSRSREVERGVFVSSGMITARMDEREFPVLPVSEVALKGTFNLENALAATAISLAAGCPVSAIADVLRTFRGVEHRLEYVATVNGVSFYNDSKATNAQAAAKALESFAEPVVWIGGGLDRGVDFKELVPVLKEKVKAMVAYGQTKDILLERGKEADIKEVYTVSTLDEAVVLANRLASAGDVVLLSPACASWDQYTSFEERGSIFKQAVHSLQI
ncbi:UDP-N-acetylmuramoyl-L-alanine--D-glutamate ligase [Thermoactinomyces sp. CICC 10523]|uniref:UDP-N-acetylmuramoyl-L-alanine--D-glutamate ligase n=1 Tax=Thermoactinomyces sp. CICC 10523 TaxID=2767428 RepID=UPI0018DCCF21|nr:UDP-N-acetylmuramoyl-L-alanine--D-glutamate ligase [Thermoactinomyces sp. CICC 10523]MBH8598060.1 UDP-N-acetylmuramoyl-L-alanine--D-glutamate ligase [Thermoactinomyces sp. CICC 10523]